MREKRRNWRILTVILAFLLLWTAAVSVNAATASGRCGAKLYWSYDETTGTLAFTGTGAMFSYTEQSAPWLAYADKIEKITFEKGITTISNRAFYGCVALQSASLPGTVTSVGESAFENCVALTNLPLGTGNCTVGDNAFRGCAGLVSLTIPEGVTSVGAGAFDGCCQAQSLVLPKSLTTIGKGAFRGCTALREISVAAGNPAFMGSGNCLISAEGVLLLGSADSVIPTDGSVHTIGADAFRASAGLQTVTIPNSVTTIEDYAFLECTDLSQVNFGTGLTHIGLGAFQGCSSLQKAQLPDGLTEIGTCAFSGCWMLEEVNFPEDLESLGSWAFAGTAIQTVSLSRTVEFVGINPFRGCQDLKSISVNYRNRSYKAQGNCLINSSDKVLISGCSTSQIPDGAVVTIGRDAFREMDVSALTIPDSVQNIETYAFTDSALESIGLGAGVKNIQGNPWTGCKQLTSIAVSEENAVYRMAGNCLLSGTMLVAGCAQSQIPRNITEIGPEAFSGIEITQITLPEGVTHIHKRAFFGCAALTTADLPDSLIYIGESAFELSGLKYLALGPIPQIDSYAFLGCYGLKSICTVDAAMLKPGKTDNGYIAYYAQQLMDVPPQATHYIGNELQMVYGSLREAIENCEEGWLQLNCSVEETVTLKNDLYIDLAGFDLGGTMDTAGFKVYGMDSTTDEYTCQNTGLFTCAAPDGTAIVPQRHFTAEQGKRYLAVWEEGGYSFHRFYVDMIYITLNVDRVGIGYKAVFRGDEKVIAQLDPQEAFSYELRLKGYNSVFRSIAAADMVSDQILRLLVYNCRVQEHGETPLSAWVSLKFSDGTVIKSENRTITMRQLVETIDRDTSILNEKQLEGLLKMMETFPVMKTWEVSHILALAQ